MANENDTKTSNSVGLSGTESPVKSPVDVPVLSFGAFPPTCIEDIMSFDGDEICDGYRDYRPDEPVPGENRAPGYRWGWANAKRDHTFEDDDFVALRHQYIRALRSAA